jgi:hypothetical protein
MAGRSCLFCGDRPVTDEHVIPTWIFDYLGLTDVTRTDHLRKTTHRTRKTFEQISRRFCKPCNTEWMNSLEIAAQRWLKPLLRRVHGEPLNFEAQVTMSSWAWKTSLTYGATSKRYPLDELDLQEYRRFRDSGFPEPTGYVWWGYFNRTDRQGSLVDLDTALSETSSLRVFTITVGGIWMQTLRHRHLQMPGRIAIPNDDPMCCRIWPPAGKVAAPPATAISQQQVGRLASRWANATRSE